MGARDRRQRARRVAPLHRRLIDAYLGEPPEQVSAAVAARQTAVSADGENDAPAGATQLLRDLRTRSAGADHQHRAWRQLFGIFVAAGMNLKDALVAQQVRHQRSLI